VFFGFLPPAKKATSAAATGGANSGRGTVRIGQKKAEHLKINIKR